MEKLACESIPAPRLEADEYLPPVIKEDALNRAPVDRIRRATTAPLIEERPASTRRPSHAASRMESVVEEELEPVLILSKVTQQSTHQESLSEVDIERPVLRLARSTTRHSSESPSPISEEGYDEPVFPRTSTPQPILRATAPIRVQLSEEDFEASLLRMRRTATQPPPPTPETEYDLRELVDVELSSEPVMEREPTRLNSEHVASEPVPRQVTIQEFLERTESPDPVIQRMAKRRPTEQLSSFEEIFTGVMARRQTESFEEPLAPPSSPSTEEEIVLPSCAPSMVEYETREYSALLTSCAGYIPSRQESRAPGCTRQKTELLLCQSKIRRKLTKLKQLSGPESEPSTFSESNYVSDTGDQTEFKPFVANVTSRVTSKSNLELGSARSSILDEPLAAYDVYRATPVEPSESLLDEAPRVTEGAPTRRGSVFRMQDELISTYPSSPPLTPLRHLPIHAPERQVCLPNNNDSVPKHVLNAKLSQRGVDHKPPMAAEQDPEDEPSHASNPPQRISHIQNPRRLLQHNELPNHHPNLSAASHDLQKSINASPKYYRPLTTSPADDAAQPPESQPLNIAAPLDPRLRTAKPTHLPRKLAKVANYRPDQQYPPDTCVSCA